MQYKNNNISIDPNKFWSDSLVKVLTVLVIFVGASLLVTQTSPLFASGCVSNVEADFSTDGLSVTAISDKSLSNVVLQFADGSEQKFEINKDGEYSLDFSGTGLNDGKIITGVWIKSGCEKSGDGPGYGEFIERCSFSTTVSITPPTLTVVEGGSADFVISLSDTEVPAGCLATIQIETLDEARNGNQATTTGVDYAPVNISYEFIGSNVSIPLNIDVLSNFDLEFDETFVVSVTPGLNSVVENSDESVVTIIKQPLTP